MTDFFEQVGVGAGGSAGVKYLAGVLFGEGEFGRGNLAFWEGVNGL